MKKEISEIASPCIGICALHKIDNETLCAGCKRNPDEIRNWIKFSDKEKLNILEKLKTRYSVYKSK